ncbi:hypothetical protein GCM10027443_13000 [Pontibacter brevis]
MLAEDVYGRIFLYVHIDTTTQKIAKVLVTHATLKRKADDSDYLLYRMDADFDKVETYPKKLRDLYPFLVNYATGGGITIEKTNSTKGWGRYVAYSIGVKIED